MVGVVFSSFFVFSSVSRQHIVPRRHSKESLKLRVGRDLKIQLVPCSMGYMNVFDSSSPQRSLRLPYRPNSVVSLSA